MAAFLQAGKMVETLEVSSAATDATIQKLLKNAMGDNTYDHRNLVFVVPDATIVSKFVTQVKAMRAPCTLIMSETIKYS